MTDKGRLVGEAIDLAGKIAWNYFNDRKLLQRSAWRMSA